MTQSPESAEKMCIRAPDRTAWAGSMQPVLATLQEQLRARRPQAVAAMAGADWQGETATLVLTCLGRKCQIPWPELVIYEAETGRPCATEIQGLCLYYLVQVDGTPPAGDWITYRELPDGWLYHRAFQAYTGQHLARAVGNDLELLGRAAAAVGGQKLALGDAAYCFTVLPRLPLALVYWRGDDEFDPYAQLLFDANAGRCLTTDGLAVAGRRLVQQLVRACERERASDP